MSTKVRWTDNSILKLSINQNNILFSCKDNNKVYQVCKNIQTDLKLKSADGFFNNVDKYNFEMSWKEKNPGEIKIKITSKINKENVASIALIDSFSKRTSWIDKNLTDAPSIINSFKDKNPNNKTSKEEIPNNDIIIKLKKF